MTFCLFVVCMQLATSDTQTHMNTHVHTHTITACIQRLSALTMMNCLAVARLRHSLSPWQHMMMSRCSKVFLRMCVHLSFSLSVFFFEKEPKKTHEDYIVLCSSQFIVFFIIVMYFVFRMVNIITL